MSDKEPKIDITQFNKFAFWLDENELSDKAALMYYALVTAANIEHWRQPFRLSNIVLMRRIGTKRLATLQEARKELVDKKLILYTAAKGRSEPEYTLLELKNNCTDNVQLSDDDKNNCTDNVQLSDDDKNNCTDNVQLNYTDNVQLKPVNSTDNVPFTQSIPIYKKHINIINNTTTNIVNTNIEVEPPTEQTATSSCEIIDFSPVKEVERILGVTCSRYQAEQYKTLLDEVGKKTFKEALQIAAENNKKHYSYVKATAENLKNGVDFREKPKEKTMKERKEELEAWAKANGYD